MRKTTPARSGPGLKALLAAVLVAPVGIGLAMLPSGAAEEPDAGHDHADHAHPAMTADLQRELARVRAATAKFHDVDAAVAAGYELGWVNGAGTRIVAGCVAHPAGPARWATTTSTRPDEGRQHRRVASRGAGLRTDP